jgi:hypothetical protein
MPEDDNFQFGIKGNIELMILRNIKKIIIFIYLKIFMFFKSWILLVNDIFI